MLLIFRAKSLDCSIKNLRNWFGYKRKLQTKSKNESIETLSKDKDLTEKKPNQGTSSSSTSNETFALYPPNDLITKNKISNFCLNHQYYIQKPQIMNMNQLPVMYVPVQSVINPQIFNPFYKFCILNLSPIQNTNFLNFPIQ